MGSETIISIFARCIAGYSKTRDDYTDYSVKWVAEFAPFPGKRQVTSAARAGVGRRAESSFDFPTRPRLFLIFEFVILFADHPYFVELLDFV